MENTMKSSGAPVPAPLPADGQDKEGLKRAYDDALAARGLISVSRSSEKLTDLALPAKMQRTISQEYLKSMTGSTTFTTFSFNPQPAPPPEPAPSMPVVHPALQNSQQGSILTQNGTHENDSVEVPATTKCAICNQTNVDTQFRVSITWRLGYGRPSATALFYAIQYSNIVHCFCVTAMRSFIPWCLCEGEHPKCRGGSTMLSNRWPNYDQLHIGSAWEWIC